MIQKRREYTLRFEFQIVLEVLRNEGSEAEIDHIYGVRYPTLSK